MCVKFEGRLFKDGRFWPVHVPALDVYTQGKSKKDAYAMIKEAVELYIDRPGFKAEVIPMAGDRFVLKAADEHNDKYLVALMLKNHRAKHGLSIEEVARRLGVARGTYAQYELARSLPSIAKIEEYIRAMSDHAHVVLDVIDTKAKVA